jgi:hypothetical protein
MSYPDFDIKRIFDSSVLNPEPARWPILVLNPDPELLFSATVQAHQFLMQAAMKEGWEAEGSSWGEFLAGGEYKKYKDPFAVFNDHPDTTVEDVKLMMKKAIELAEEADG